MSRYYPVVACLLIGLALGCRTGSSSKPSYSCIQPPPPHRCEFNRGVYTEAAAALEKMQVDDTLEINYDKALNTYFLNLLRNGMRGLALFLNAMDCYITKGASDGEAQARLDGQLLVMMNQLESKWTWDSRDPVTVSRRKETLLQDFRTIQIEGYRKKQWFPARGRSISALPTETRNNTVHRTILGALADSDPNGMRLARLGKKQLGLRGIGLQLFTQVRHVDAKVMGAVVVSWTPDFVKNLAVSERFAGVSDQESEEVSIRCEVSFTSLRPLTCRLARSTTRSPLLKTAGSS